ncbi:MAG TPA: polymer-forming cytoskeletal protein [Pyrinomonadaceae bacterium]|nr:polymer-forming cytoskeletal protein [Pyrinomonadaceae bacterium]
MSFTKSGSDFTADESFLSKAGGTDSPESEQNLQSATDQDWLEGLDLSELSPPVTHESSIGDYASNRQREINFEGTLTVEGYAAGLICSPEGTLIVGERGEIDGDLLVNIAIVYGTVRGEIRATKKVELGASSRVIGDIETMELAIHPGAIFEGRCAFPPAEPKVEADVSLTAAN